MIVTIKFDTEQEMCTVDMDGTTIENVESISVYKEYEHEYDKKESPSYEMNIYTKEELPDGMKKYVTLSAKEKLHSSIANIILGE
jgi:hypothetical protein